MPMVLPGVEGAGRGFQGTPGYLGQLSPPGLGWKSLCLPHPSPGLPASPALPPSAEAAPPSPGTLSSLLWTLGGPCPGAICAALGVGEEKPGWRVKNGEKEGERRDFLELPPQACQPFPLIKSKRSRGGGLFCFGFAF